MKQIRPVTALSLSVLVFTLLVIAQAWALGQNPGTVRLVTAALSWTVLCAFFGGLLVGVSYIFDITNPKTLKAHFSRYTLMATAVFAFGLLIAITSDEPPVFDAPLPEAAPRF